MEHDAWFFVGIFVFIFLIWIVSGGPTHPIAFSGPTLAQPGPLGGGTYISLPSSPFKIGGSNVSLPGSSSGGGAIGSTNTNGNSSFPNIPGETTFGVPSPYRGIVSLNHYVSGAGSNPNNEYVALSVSQGTNVPVDISGWTIQSDTSGNASVIPKGTQVPTSGIVNAVQDIVLTPGEQALLISGQSHSVSAIRPISGLFQVSRPPPVFPRTQIFRWLLNAS